MEAGDFSEKVGHYNIPNRVKRFTCLLIIKTTYFFTVETLNKGCWKYESNEFQALDENPNGGKKWCYQKAKDDKKLIFGLKVRFD